MTTLCPTTSLCALMPSNWRRCAALGARLPGKQQLYAAQSPEVLSDLQAVAGVHRVIKPPEGVVVAAHRLKSLVLKTPHRNRCPSKRQARS